jgi:cysteine sulfinate desulfinase/cysteine desulfurase-like protein
MCSIYADNASTTQLDPDALEAMLPFMRDSAESLVH